MKPFLLTLAIVGIFATMIAAIPSKSTNVAAATPQAANPCPWRPTAAEWSKMEQTAKLAQTSSAKIYGMACASGVGAGVSFEAFNRSTKNLASQLNDMKRRQ